MNSTKVKLLNAKKVLQYFFIIGVGLFISLTSRATNAPVTTIASVVNAKAGEQVIVPVTVSGFKNIGGFTLALDYDYDKLHFVSGQSNSSLGGVCDIGDIDLGNGFHRLTISWYKSGAGVSLEDGSTIVDYVFTFLSGPATLNWYDMGPSCVYNDPAANTLTDVPASAFYFNGLVSDAVLPKPSITANGPTTFSEGDSVILTSSAGYAYIWSNGATTPSIVVSKLGSYSVQTKDADGFKSEPSDTVEVNVIAIGNTQLEFSITNPRIINDNVENYFEFDVQVKADVSGSYLWSGQINLDFRNLTLSSRASNWILTKSSLFNARNTLGNEKYNIDMNITGSTIMIKFKADENAINLLASESNFVEITSENQKLLSIRGKVISNTGVAGIDFNESLMTGKQFYKLSSTPWFESYATTNSFGSRNFMDTYVGRIFSSSGWTQVTGLDWSEELNTSVWNGNATISGDNISKALNLRIHEPANLTIPIIGKMTVAGNLEIKKANGLIIQSDEPGTGSLITKSAVGKAFVRKYVTAKTWTTISSPVSDQSITNFLTANSIIGSSEDLQSRHMTDYNAVSNEWNSNFSNLTKGNIEAGIGYNLQSIANGTINFSGFVQTGNFIVNCTPDMWNCVGNPYTSAIRINSNEENLSNFLSENIENLDPLFGAVYLLNRDKSTDEYGNYKVISNALESFDLQQGQAFFVKLKAGANAVNFKPTMQVHNPLLVSKLTSGSNSSIELAVSGDSIKATTLITFNDYMTTGLDPTYDAGFLKGNSDLTVYSYLIEKDDVPLAIQALPADDYLNLIIPIGLEFSTEGEMVFTATASNLPFHCEIILEDQENETLINLSHTDYKVKIDANSKLTDRFRIHTSYLTTGVNKEKSFGKITVYTIQNECIMIKGALEKGTTAKLYDLHGKLLVSEILEVESQNRINISGIEPGIYLFSVESKTSKHCSKIAIRK